MKKEVLIKLTSIQTVDGESTQTELITSGTLEQFENGYVISYDESEATGFSGSTTTITIKGNDWASIDRHGNSNSSLIVERGTKHHCHYGTPFGDFTIGIYANSIINELTGDGGQLYLKYTVDINSSYISDNEILLVI